MSCLRTYCDGLCHSLSLSTFPSSKSSLVCFWSLRCIFWFSSNQPSAPVGAVLRVIFSGCERMCVRAALIFYLRQVHISPVRRVGLQQDQGCGTLAAKQLHQCSFHALRRPTNARGHFPRGRKTRCNRLDITRKNNAYTVRARAAVCVFRNQCRIQAVKRAFGRACNLHDFRQWLNPAPSP